MPRSVLDLDTVGHDFELAVARARLHDAGHRDDVFFVQLVLR